MLALLVADAGEGEGAGAGAMSYSTASSAASSAASCSECSECADSTMGASLAGTKTAGLWRLARLMILRRGVIFPGCNGSLFGLGFANRVVIESTDARERASYQVDERLTWRGRGETRDAKADDMVTEG